MFALLSTARKAGQRLFAVGALLATAACNTSIGDIGASQPSIKAGAPVPVALLLPKSDPTAQSLPRDLENAARLALAGLDGVQIDLRVYDTAGNPTVAAQVAGQAVNDGAKIILGPLYQKNAVAVSQAVAGQGINVLSFSNNTDIAGGNLFLLGDLFINRADRLLGYAKRQGKSSVAVIYENSTGGQVGARAIGQAAVNNGVELVGTAGYDLNSQSLSAAIAKTRGYVQQGGAQSVFLTDNWDQGLSVALQLMPEQGIDPTVTKYMGLSRWDSRRDGFNLAGIKGGWFTVPDMATVQQFETRFQEAYGAIPHPLAGLAFDGVAAIGALVKQGRADALSTTALTQSAGFQGSSGVFRLKADGTNERGLAVATIENNQMVILDRAPSSFGGFGF
ncbi:penicillin-binding protein activator [Pseudoprimorskyibacter insulae]|uniref:Penicillin-binding protein activator LpoA n=1 Tax=Pseudoprimorskyibacter insulae TaxID=1695997 RepID=A0A2R8ANR2_9RHOB|nr:penicillin-binding protein activator [Pseudoprimorskyibacter insulae]SPF77620.1 Penicillin-binding protein activator LpoA [Pseudoprimorskyibacter insulae]